MKYFLKFIPRTLYSNLLMAFLFVIACFSIFDGDFIFLTNTTYNDMYVMQQKTMEVQLISTQTDVLFEQISTLSVQRKTELYGDFKKRLNTQKMFIYDLYNKSSKPIRYRYKSIYNITLTFEEACDELYAMLQTDVHNIYIDNKLILIDKLRGYIQQEYSVILNFQIAETQAFYDRVGANIKSMEQILTLLLIGSVIIFVVFALAFSSRTVAPIHELVKHAQRVLKRNFTPFIPTKKLPYHEIDILIETYNNLIAEIRIHLEKAIEAAQIERSLREQAVKTMALENELKQSELNFLQSQINPHFLFNTLNAIAAMAEIEGANKSYDAIYNLAEITRYNLKNISHFVSLEDELNLIRSYLLIQKIRFGDRLQFAINIDESLLKIRIPSMIIQPFVENAIIHGLEPKSGTGNLKLFIYDHGETVSIVIKDDGIGIPSDILNEISKFEADGDLPSGSNIGMINVLRRLKMLYGGNVVSITSWPNLGTEVRITLNKDILTR